MNKKQEVEIFQLPVFIVKAQSLSDGIVQMNL
jgi:hypothetical protein